MKFAPLLMPKSLVAKHVFVHDVKVKTISFRVVVQVVIILRQHFSAQSGRESVCVCANVFHYTKLEYQSNPNNKQTEEKNHHHISANETHEFPFCTVLRK